jgi:hypothetical protein
MGPIRPKRVQRNRIPEQIHEDLDRDLDALIEQRRVITQSLQPARAIVAVLCGQSEPPQSIHPTVQRALDMGYDDGVFRYLGENPDDRTVVQVLANNRGRKRRHFQVARTQKKQSLIRRDFEARYLMAVATSNNKRGFLKGIRHELVRTHGISFSAVEKATQGFRKTVKNC